VVVLTVNRDVADSMPDYLDHQKTELSTYNLVIHVFCNLTGQMWSDCPAFVK